MRKIENDTGACYIDENGVLLRYESAVGNDMGHEDPKRKERGRSIERATNSGGTVCVKNGASRYLVEASDTLLKLDAPITQIVGYPEHRIVQSCMTLFHTVSREPVFQEVLDKFFEGKPDEFTINRISV